MSDQIAFWEYDPKTDELTWSFPQLVREFIHDGDWDRLLILVRAVSEGREACVNCEMLWIDPGPAGDKRWIAAYGGATNACGPAKVMGVALDVTDRRQREKQALLVSRELNHRVRNALMLLQAVTSRTIQNASSLADAEQTLLGRLAAFGDCETLLHEDSWRDATIRSVFRQTLLRQGLSARVALHGPPARLSAEVAVGLSMVAHELATNARKYGALSNDAGRISVRWRVDADHEAASITWRETDGPSVGPVHRIGFGTRLIRQVLSQHKTGVDLDFSPSGVSCALSDVPLEVCSPEPAKRRLAPYRVSPRAVAPLL